MCGHRRVWSALSIAAVLGGCGSVLDLSDPVPAATTDASGADDAAPRDATGGSGPHVADSEADFADHQRYRGWEYLVREGGALRELTYFSGCWRPQINADPSICKKKMQASKPASGSEQLPVRRWLASIDGKVRLDIAVERASASDTCGDGRTLRLLVDGTERAAIFVASNEARTLEQAVVVEVQVGSAVDFELAPGRDHECDDTELTATVTSAP